MNSTLDQPRLTRDRAYELADEYNPDTLRFERVLITRDQFGQRREVSQEFLHRTGFETAINEARRTMTLDLYAEVHREKIDDSKVRGVIEFDAPIYVPRGDLISAVAFVWGITLILAATTPIVVAVLAVLLATALTFWSSSRFVSVIPFTDEAPIEMKRVTWAYWPDAKVPPGRDIELLGPAVRKTEVGDGEPMKLDAWR